MARPRNASFAGGGDDVSAFLRDLRALRSQVRGWTELSAESDADDAFRLCFRLIPPLENVPTGSDKQDKPW